MRMFSGITTAALLLCLTGALALRDVQELWRLQDARSGSPCLATDGTNNWGVFQDNYARQGMLWSQTPDALSLWGFGGSCASAKPSLEGVFATPAETCPAINTAYNRDLYRSTNVPYTCNCTRTAFDLCVYQLQVSDTRCGTPYKIWFAQSPNFPVGERLGDGEVISGATRLAIDSIVGGGGSSGDACSPLANAPDMSGHWCVVQRGGCSTETKVRNCFGGTTNANRVLGVVIVDNVPYSPNGLPSSSPGPVSFALPVPVLMVAFEEGQRLRGALGQTVFTLSKTIGPAAYTPTSAPAIVAREQRTGQWLNRGSGAGPAAFRFFWEPNRLLVWAFGYRAADRTTDNVALFDSSDPTRQPTLLRSWSYAALGLDALDWTVGSLVFAQQSPGRSNATFFWIVGNGTSYVVWNVTGAPATTSLVPMASIPRTGAIFINRDASTLWQQVASPVDGQLHGWRYQQAWDIRNMSCPRLLGAFALDASFLTWNAPTNGQTTFAFPTFDVWGSSLVSFNLGDDGIGFYNYSNAVAPTLAAYRDTSPSSCAPVGVGGPSGAIVPSPSQPNVWIACQQHEPVPLWQCGVGAVNAPTTPACEPSAFRARVDYIGYQVLPAVRVSDKCEDGAIVNLFWTRQQ